MEFVDIHNHFTWDVDDGMDNKENAIRALRDAKKDGIQKLIATPHFIPGLQNEEDVSFINKRIAELQLIGKVQDIEVYYGSEVFLNDAYLDMLDNNCVNTLANSDYLLCEFDVRKDLANNKEAEEQLYEISIRNLIPVIAHVERYFHSGLDLKRIQQWVKNGYVMQVNRTSLLGLHSEQVRKNAIKLLKTGMVHVVASDAHRVSGQRIGKLSDAYEMVRDLTCKENAELLFNRNPMHLIHNEDMEQMVMVKKKISLFNR